MERIQTEKALADHLDTLCLDHSAELDPKKSKIVVMMDKDLFNAIGAISDYFLIPKAEYMRRVTRADVAKRRGQARKEHAKAAKLADIGRRLLEERE